MITYILLFISFLSADIMLGLCIAKLPSEGMGIELTVLLLAFWAVSAVLLKVMAEGVLHFRKLSNTEP
ncbi:hypothetical protein [Neptuniibacter sp. QD37_11]|uniref:hypothetical protein n=1 Tax=Neptuniibacter sp. QD37_11 TaxID=3398209 RepID=UPI0039F49DC8